MIKRIWYICSVPADYPGDVEALRKSADEELEALLSDGYTEVSAVFATMPYSVIPSASVIMPITAIIHTLYKPKRGEAGA